MTSEQRRVADAARDATFSFLGRYEVCGVGLTHDGGSRISFLLRRDSAEARTVLTRWASDRGVAINIDIASRELAPLAVARPA